MAARDSYYIGTAFPRSQRLFRNGGASFCTNSSKTAGPGKEWRCSEFGWLVMAYSNPTRSAGKRSSSLPNGQAANHKMSLLDFVGVEWESGRVDVPRFKSTGEGFYRG